MTEKLGKFRKEMNRLEVKVPAQGNEFIGPQANTAGTSADHSLQLRVVGGHSFLSGFDDTIFFDGEIDLEVKFMSRGYSAKLTKELFDSFLSNLCELFPGRYMGWDFSRGVVNLGLMLNTDTAVDKSSLIVLNKLADRFGLQGGALQDQAKWHLVTR